MTETTKPPKKKPAKRKPAKRRSKSRADGKPEVRVTAKMIAQAEVMATYGMKRKLIAEYFGLSWGKFNEMTNGSPRLLKALRRGNAVGVESASKQLFEAVEKGEPWAIKFFLTHRGLFNTSATTVDDPADAPDTIPDSLPPDPNEAAKVYRDIMYGGKNK